ncbi:hypothetical protein AD998_11860 [bacterium 336/3]|nr:hypothetical protein AD998_11860 [bacterium 336/3]
MKKKLLIGISIFYFLPLMLTILQGCTCGSSRKQTYFEVTKMYLVTKVGGSIYDDTEIPVSSISQVSLWLRTDVRYYSSTKPFSSGFSAMALSCEEVFTSKETIESIEVYSNKDFEGYPAGTNLTDIMRLRDTQGGNFLDISKRFIAKESYELLFKENVTITPNNHLFRVILKDSKGKVFDMIKEVKFK